jgi:hypothetical protein
VADREADIYRLLADMVTAGQRFIIRAVQDRVVEIAEEDLAPLFKVAGETHATFTMEVPLSRNGKRPVPSKLPVRPARTATLSLRHLDKPKLAEDATLRDALLAIAALGGHINNNGDPGGQVLSRDWQRLRDYEAVFRLARGDL